MSAREGFSCALAPHMEGLVARKRALGFDYSSACKQLARLDRFCISEDFTGPAVTRDLCVAWAEAIPGEGGPSRSDRMSALRQLALYERSIGLGAYVPRLFSSREKPAVYLPTAEETRALFAAIDACAPDPRFQHMAAGYGIAFRLMRCCGMRVSECANLAAADVDPDAGTLLVRHSKGDKDRIVYMAADMADAVRRHMLDQRRLLGFWPDWLLPGRNPSRPIPAGTLDVKFAEFWAQVPGAAARSRHPTPHSLRHAFVVDRMNRWMTEGVSLKQMMPYLASYLGHSCADETFYYYHQVVEAGRIVRERDSVSARVIPEAIPHEE